MFSPANNSFRRISKAILDNIDTKLFEETKVNQWENMVRAIEWLIC